MISTHQYNTSAKKTTTIAIVLYTINIHVSIDTFT